jgi:hypothetical protein
VSDRPFEPSEPSKLDQEILPLTLQMALTPGLRDPNHHPLGVLVTASPHEIFIVVTQIVRIWPYKEA